MELEWAEGDAHPFRSDEEEVRIERAGDASWLKCLWKTWVLLLIIMIIIS